MMEYMEMLPPRLNSERDRISSNIWHPSGGLTVAQRSALEEIGQRLSRMSGAAGTCCVDGCPAKPMFDHGGRGKFYCEEHYVDKCNYRIR